jgi:apolipoprotein N-acyltransferase
MISWSAAMINWLWEEKWDIKKLGYSALVYAATVATMLVCGGIVTAFPKRADVIVPVAGITIENRFFERMANSGLYLDEIFQLDTTVTSELIGSSSSDVREMCQKTLEAVQAGAKVIVWQEYALVLDSSIADTLLQEMKNLADKKDIYLLVSYARILNEKEREERQMKNIGVLFTPEGEIGWEYAKAFPGAGFEDLMIEGGQRSIPYVDTPYGWIGQVICADMIFPRYIRQAAARDVGLLLVPAFDVTTFVPLITFGSAFRAVENGFTMVRISGGGDSAVIDPYYRQWAGQSFQELGSRTFYANVPVVTLDTFNAGIGYIFPYVILFLLLSLIVLATKRAAKN